MRNAVRSRSGSWTWVGAVLALTLLVPGLSVASEGEAALAVADLRVERVANPRGIDAPTPRLSWELVSQRRGVTQASYQILVASRPELLEVASADVWDSGEVASDASINVVYGGPQLQSKREYFWTVVVTDDAGARATGAPASWEMGLLRPEDWQAGWIGQVPVNGATWQADRTLRTGNHLQGAQYNANILNRTAIGPSQGVYSDALTAQPAPYLRKSFTVDRPVASARVYSTALGVYELRLNGQKVGNDLLAPGWTDYAQRVQYQTYDVTQQLRQGSNAIGALLGLGWYAGHTANVGARVYGETPAFLAQLEITYTDGTTARVVTDGTWKVSVGAVRAADFLMGEHHDARLEPVGWDTPGYLDAAWAPVAVSGPVGDVGGTLVAQADPPVQALAELPAVARTSPAAGTYIFDLGQNFAGVVRLKVNGPSGTTVQLRHGEVLNPNGTLYVANLRGAKQTDSYTLAGGGQEVWQPRFTSHGFRYVEVTGYPGVPGLDAVTGVAIGNATPDTGTFTSSDPQLNQLQSNIRWGQRSNFLSVPTDCPQRDERGGWTGDTQIFARTAAFNADVSNFYTKWLRDLNDAQRTTGSYTDIAPYVSEAIGSPGWGDAGVVVPWQMYLAYGDTAMIDEHWSGMTRWVEYLRTNSTGLIRPAVGYGDWLNHGDDTPKDLIATAYFAHSSRLVARMAEATGRTDDAAKYHELADAVRTAFQGRYVGDDGTVSGGSQTSYVLALSMDLVPEPLRQAAAARLVELVEGRDWHLSTGFLGTRDLMHVLTQTGHGEVAYRLLNQRDFPSWRYMIERGATTMWERWDGIRVDGSFQAQDMNSFNHYAYGAVGEWLYRRVAGLEIDPSKPAYHHTIIDPQPGGGLTAARATYDSAYGLVASGWRSDGERFELDVTIPANTTATLRIPAHSSVSEAGRELVGVGGDGLQFVELRDGVAVFEAGSGTYTLTSDGGAGTGGGHPDPDPTPTPTPTQPPGETPYDYVDLGVAASEQAHNLAASLRSGTSVEAGRTRRYTYQGTPLGYFEFDAKIEAGQPFRIRSVETYDGNAGIRDYYVLVNGTRVYTRNVPNRTTAGLVEYEITVSDPALLSSGSVRIRFEEDELARNYDPSIADVWTLPVADG